MSYNGWTNYETWNVALWIDDEEGMYYEAREIVLDNWEDERPWTAGETLKTWIEELMPDLGASMWSDLLTAALSEVNWTEIAEHYYEDDREEDDD